jgi:hypothetical protein
VFSINCVNFLVFPQRLVYIDLTEGSETSANINQTLGKHPKVNIVIRLIKELHAFYGTGNFIRCSQEPSAGTILGHILTPSLITVETLGSHRLSAAVTVVTTGPWELCHSNTCIRYVHYIHTHVTYIQIHYIHISINTVQKGTKTLM